MQNPQRLSDQKQDAIRYRAGRFATVPASLIEFLVRVKVGRNGFAVIASLCRYVKPDGTFEPLLPEDAFVAKRVRVGRRVLGHKYRF